MDYILRIIQTLLDTSKKIIYGIDQGALEQARIEIDKAYELLGKPKPNTLLDTGLYYLLSTALKLNNVSHKTAFR